MQLTHFTDLGLRVLMYASQPQRVTQSGKAVTISEIAESLHVSRNHLVKVVHFMASHQWLSTTRGKGGGLALAKTPDQYNLGQLVRILEGTTQVVNCAEPPCALRFGCGLKGLLDEALQAFFQSLDRYTLADIIQGKTQEILSELQRIHIVQLSTDV
ncbi:MAG: Rrf2 family transcriptional regulator [Candidatus Saccharibacteria bacterium]|nr:Rrf2 family transcriptional regulator [Moraxellaceae bacterium]